ncbi:MAG: dGTP triphosphohydrolase [Pirellula sp.]|jgi:dGTPase
MTPHFALRPKLIDSLSWQQRERLLLAPYAFFSECSRGRIHEEAPHPYRNPYQRDRDRVLHSAAFRRLSGKMQVFTGDMGDYHRTRLTHTHEVSSLARTIGRTLRLNEDLIEAMALLHDIGHPPYGHCGEDALELCTKDVGGFSHNQFALDLVTRIEQRYTGYPGLNLTYEVLAGQKFRSDKDSGRTQMLEIQVVDMADSMAYDAHDVDDALKLGLLNWRQLDGLALVQRAKRIAPLDQCGPQNRRQMLVHALLDVQMQDFLSHSEEILAEVQQLDSQSMCDMRIQLSMSPTFAADKAELEEFLFEHVYRHPKLAEIRKRAATRIHQLFRLLKTNPQRLPDRFSAQVNEWGLERTIACYIAGMTDRFCDDQYVLLLELGRDKGIDWS